MNPTTPRPPHRLSSPSFFADALSSIRSAPELSAAAVSEGQLHPARAGTFRTFPPAAQQHRNLLLGAAQSGAEPPAVTELWRDSAQFLCSSSNDPAREELTWRNVNVLRSSHVPIPIRIGAAATLLVASLLMGSSTVLADSPCSTLPIDTTIPNGAWLTGGFDNHGATHQGYSRKHQDVQRLRRGHHTAKSVHGRGGSMGGPCRQEHHHR